MWLEGFSCFWAVLWPRVVCPVSFEQAAQMKKLELFSSLMIEEWATMVDAGPRCHHVTNKSGSDQNEDLSLGRSLGWSVSWLVG